MIETIIYCAGAIAIILALAAIAGMAILILSLLLTKHLAVELKSTYNHYQLKRMMFKLKKFGFDEVYKSETKDGKND